MTGGGVDRSLECTGNVNAMISAFECVHDVCGLSILLSHFPGIQAKPSFLVLSHCMGLFCVAELSHIAVSGLGCCSNCGGTKQRWCLQDPPHQPVEWKNSQGNLLWELQAPFWYSGCGGKIHEQGKFGNSNSLSKQIFKHKMRNAKFLFV